MNKNRRKKFSIIAALSLMTMFSLSYKYYQKANSNDFLVKAGAGQAKTVEKKNLLLPDKWVPTSEINSANGTNRSKLSKNLTSDLISVISWGQAKLVDNGLYAKNFLGELGQWEGEKFYWRSPKVGASQKVTVDVGKYYLYSFDVQLSDDWSSTQNIFYKMKSDHIKNWYFSPQKNIWTNKKKSFAATTTSEEVFFYAPEAVNNYTSAEFKNIQLVDITDEVLSFLARIDELFTSETRSTLKLSTTQKKIDSLKDERAVYADVLSTADNDKATTRLAAAQNLLDSITMSLVIDTLGDNPAQTSSHIISGKTAPNAFLHFASNSQQFPEGPLGSEVEQDQINYQIRADQTGSFQYKLPENTYLKAGEILTVISMLNGKTATADSVVKDTTPPSQPTLNLLKDTDNTFSGTAESKSAVNIYDEQDKNLFLSGHAGADGQYTLNIPEIQKPLTPYKKYYVTATDEAGNVSVQSASQTIADTTPPTATPVKQMLTLGDPLPDIGKMVTAIADNAGAEQVEVAQTKSPDISKIGYTTAEITLTDAAKNKTVILVPIVIKDEQTTLDENHLLDAKDFTIQAVYYPEDEAAQRKFLLEHSQVSAWDIVNGKNAITQVIIDKKNLVREPGIHKITFQVGNLKKEITINLTVGDIAFDHLPKSMSFGTVTIRSKEQMIKSENSIQISVNDTRFRTNDWRLLTRLDRPLQTNEGNQMLGGIFYQEKDEHGNWVEKMIDDKMDTEVYRKTNANYGKTTVDFFNDKEISLSVLPGNINKLYSTNIIWTLENAP